MATPGVSGKDLTALGIGGASLLPMLFGGGEDKDVSGALGDLKKNTADLTAKSDVLGKQGADTLGPALKFIQALASGDSAAIASATMPERKRVIDQYDTAKRAAAEFSPRGGGQAGALSSLNASEASDLSSIGNTARTSAVSTAASTGTGLESLGLSGTQAAGQNLNTILQTYMKQAEEKGQSASDFGSSIASLLGLVFAL